MGAATMESPQCPGCQRLLFGSQTACPACGTLLDPHSESLHKSFRYALSGAGLVFCGLAAYLWTANDLSKDLREVISMLHFYIGLCALTGTSLGSLRTMLWANLALCAYTIHRGSPGGEAGFQGLAYFGFFLSAVTLWLVGRVRED